MTEKESQPIASRRFLFVDLDLVGRLRAGERGAFDALYAAHHRQVYGFLYRLAGRRDVADDLFQDTWIKVAQHATRLTPDTHLVAWLYTIARNVHRSHRRWSVLDLSRYLPSAELPEAVSEESPEAAAGAGQELAALERSLAKLSPASRETLLLVGIDGLDQSEGAKVVGISHAAFRQRVARARSELEALLEMETHDGRR